jgi:hypothetical protein
MSKARIGLPAAAGCGVLYPVLSIVGDDVIARGDEIASEAGTPEQVLAAIADKDASFLVGRSIGMLAAVCLFVFAAYVATRARAAAGPDSMLPPLAVCAGGIAATLHLVSAILPIAAVRNDASGLTPELAVVLMDAGTLEFLTAMLPLAVLLGVVAVGPHGALVGRALRRSAAALSIALLVGFVAFVSGVSVGLLPLLLSWLWFVAAGVGCLRREFRTNSSSTASESVGASGAAQLTTEDR